MTALKFIDLFAGIGGFRMAMERAGHECVGFCEIDRHAVKSYRAIYDTKGEYYAKDITRIDPADLPDFDCLTGGFPCQSFSVAGRREGFDDTRGTLFFDIARIAEARRPDVLLLENVKGLLSHDGGNTFRVILRTLDDLGYDCEWQVLNSKDFGVPQNRERVFIVGHLRGRGGRQVFPIGGTGQALDIEKVGAFPSNRNDGLDHASDRVYDPGGLAPTVQQRDYKGAAMVKVGNIYPSGGQAGNVYDVKGISPTVSSGETDVKGHGGIGSSNAPKVAIPQQFSDGTGLAYALDASYHKGIGPSSIGSGRRTHVVKQIMEADYDRDNPSAYRVYDADGLAPTIDTAQGVGRQPHIIARAVALQNSNMQGRRIKDDGDPTFTISATDRHGVMLANHRIRRLTPRECWRLQGFPDWAFDKAQQAGTSDTQLYRQAGNSVTVPVVEAIARRLT